MDPEEMMELDPSLQNVIEQESLKVIATQALRKFTNTDVVFVASPRGAPLGCRDGRGSKWFSTGLLTLVERAEGTEYQSVSPSEALEKQRHAKAER